MTKLNNVDQQYHDLCQHILTNGVEKSDRTGTGTKSVFGYQMRFDLQEGFPILTTKKVAFNSALHEVIWMFIQGSSEIQYLKDNNVKIWDEWQVDGSIGNVYGPIIRAYEIDDAHHIDQLQDCIDLIRTNPDSRRIVMTTWDPKTIADGSKTFQENVEEGKGVLAPCHGTVIQFYIIEGKLSLSTYQRSADVLLGLPFNIIGYSLLLHMIAQVCDLDVGELIYSVGDAHIYNNHIEQINLQMSRESYELPTLEINHSIQNIDDFRFEDFELVNYQAHPSIKAPVAV